MPQYETAADRAVENAAATSLEAHLGGRLMKLPMQYGLDWALVNEKNEVLKWVELKRRTHAYGTYETFSISLSKVMRAIHMEAATGLPAVIVVQYLNGLYVAYFRSFSGAMSGVPSATIIMGGRKDRDDPQDVEPLARLPISEMQYLCECPQQESKPEGRKEMT